MFLAVAVVGLSLTVLSGPAGAAEGPGVPTLSWQACDDGFECTTAKVPLDYDQPHGPEIGLALIRIRAGDPGRRIGSLFVNPGGPGLSGVDFVRAQGPTLLTQEVRDRFDLVGFDPRGVGRSASLQCFDTAGQYLAAMAPFAFPVTRQDETQKVASDRLLIAGCDRRAGPIIDHMATANVARDLDLLRQAVGDRLLTYVGYSYGSFLGVTYANLFPDRFRALVIDGVIDPVAWTTGVGHQARNTPISTRQRSDVGAQATLEEFFRLCDTSGERCKFSGRSAARYAALASRLRTTPLTVPDGGGGTIAFTYADLVYTTLSAMWGSSQWPSLAEVLADLETQSASPAQGPRQPGTPIVDATPATPPKGRVSPTEEAAEPYPNLEAEPGIACSDSDNPESYGPWTAQAARSETSGYFGRYWTWRDSSCAEWHGADADRYTGPFNKKTANPMLVVGTTFDPATNYDAARTVAQTMPYSSLLTVHGWGHTSANATSSCANQAVTLYLTDVATPRAGMVCEQDLAPFSDMQQPNPTRR